MKSYAVMLLFSLCSAASKEQVHTCEKTLSLFHLIIISAIAKREWAQSTLMTAWQKNVIASTQTA
jgi:hypothetical protein